MKRKFLSLILVFAMTVSLLTVGTGAVEPTYGDTAGHWAESSIERWSAYGIIQGSNGQFDPNGQLTCAQLATILAKLLKLPAAKDAGFTDNTADAWYYDAINRCAAAGILNGNGDGTVTPEAPITRERAMVMLARALGIEPIRKPDLTKYTDAAQVSAYAQGYVAAMIEAGIVGGVTADELAPQDNINRASTVTILDRAISTYADKAGATVKADGKGLVLVVAENVKITGAPEGTKIVVADGATGLTVNGKSVSDDQTYIVPKTEPAKPSGGSSGGYSHSHSYVYIDNGDGTHTGRCYANDSTLAPEAHNIVDGKCTVCGAAQTAASVASVKAADGTYTYYTTLAAALAAAQSGDTVTLVDNTTLTNSVKIDKSITLDLNGKTIHYTGENQATANPTMSHRALNVTGSTVTIKNGAITTTVVGTIYPPQNNPQAEGSEFDAIIVKSGANVTLEDMNITINDVRGSCLYVFDGGKATVKSGSYTNVNTSGDKLLLNQANVDTQLIFVEGGTFSGRNPAEGDDNMGGTFLAEGYKAVENGDGTWVVRKKENNAQVGGKNYEELSDAIEASNSIDNTITLTKNTTVKLENGVANGSEKSRNITIKGDGTQTVDVITRAISAEGGMLSYQRGSTFTFKNVTIQAGEGSFDGIVCDELVYNNCIIKGKLTLYGKATFINCTFENEMANQYSIWTWGGTDVRFEDCTFNTNGKAILLYGQATAEKPTNLTVSNCTFNDRNNGSAGKAAIEIGNDYNATYSLTVTSATVNGFADGKNTGSKIWANKNSMDAEHLTVIIDGKLASKASGATLKEIINSKPESPVEITLAENETVELKNVDVPEGYILYKKDTDDSKTYQLMKNEGNVEVSLQELQNLKITKGPKAADAQPTTFTVDLAGQKIEAGNIAYSECNSGYSGNGVLIGGTTMNSYGVKPANEGNYKFVIKGGTIVSAAKGYQEPDGAKGPKNSSVYMLVPSNSDVTFENVTFEGVVSFDIQKYTSPWSNLNSLTFKKCIFNGLIVGTCPASNITFDNCKFLNYTNETSANNSNPIWWRADNEGQGSNATYIKSFTFTNNQVTSTRPVKIERIGRDGCNPVFTFKNNNFDITSQGTENGQAKNMAINIGQSDAQSKFTLIDDGNHISKNTAALYTAAIGSGSNQYIAVSGNKVLDDHGNAKTITAMVWKTTNGDTFEMKTIQ